LVVEDDPATGLLTTSILQDCGATVDLARSRASGEALVRVVSYQLLILDFDLPDGCGLDVARAAFGRTGLARPEVICVSASMDEPRARQCRDTGATEALKKPVSTAELRRLFDALVRRK
jgi:DNA-binding response OmpR family regulator